MQINKAWRIVTIGDGDLSFSLALTKAFPGICVCSTVLDSDLQLREKYQKNAIDELTIKGHQVVFNTDITQPETLHESIKNKGVNLFDLAIFQFPLVPNAGARQPGQSWHQGSDSNLLNRKLLRDFLKHSYDYLLAPNGAQLCYITSKDVKPYCDWNIECLGEPGPMQYVGSMPFNPGKFSGYRVRNVDRDKQVKSTAANTYVWSGSERTNDSANTESLGLKPPKPEVHQYCRLCDMGPIEDEQDWLNHLNSRQHKRRSAYQHAWEEYLLNEKDLENIG